MYCFSPIGKNNNCSVSRNINAVINTIAEVNGRKTRKTKDGLPYSKRKISLVEYSNEHYSEACLKRT